jgi:hypothetical protein
LASLRRISRGRVRTPRSRACTQRASQPCAADRTPRPLTSWPRRHAAVIDGKIENISAAECYKKGWTVLLFYPKARSDAGGRTQAPLRG